MKLLIAGGDARYAHLARLAAEKERALSVAALGLERAGLPPELRANVEEAGKFDAVLLPNPFRRGMSLPLADSPFTLGALLSHMREGTPLLLRDAEGAPDHLPVPVVDLAADERFAEDNARLTAEGALAGEMARGGLALCDRRTLVLGYGRIGRWLARFLLALETPVTVCARRPEAREAARGEGAAVCSFPALSGFLPRASLIINTVPSPVLPRALLLRISSRASLVDLASPPYGFDLADARELGLCARREGGLPGRYCPESAALALLGAIERWMGGISHE